MDVITYKCPHCGAPIAYDAAQSSFHCEFCGSDVAKEDIIRQEGEAAEAAAAEKLVEYHCPSCGADLITDENTAATFCRYCGSPTIVKRNLEGAFRPDLIIPFRISKEKAQDIFKKWCHKGRFTPKGFYNRQQMEKITGIYVPFWLFDCEMTADMAGTAKKIRVWRSGDTEYTNTKNFYFARSAELSFQKVPADGSSHMDNELMDALEPYQYQEMVPFELPYLSGFAAEKYDEEAEKVFARVDQRITQASEGMLLQTVSGYSAHTVQQRNKRYTKTKPNYALLPVWMLRCRSKDKTYTFAVNGQSGKVVGKPPVSFGKVLLWMSGLSGALFALLTLGGALLL